METELYKDLSDQALIIVIDDDRIYDNQLINNFMKEHLLHPTYALTNTGWEIENLTNKNSIIP